MNKKRQVLASAMVALWFTGAAQAEFIGLVAEPRTDFSDEENAAAVQAEFDSGDYEVWTVYAVFSDPADELVAVRGTAVEPMTLTACSNVMVFQAPQESFNGWWRPNPFANFSDPINAFDTYVVIDDHAMPLLVGAADLNDIDWAGPFDDGLQVNEGGWMDAPGDSDGIGVAGADLRVRIAQITIVGGHNTPGVEFQFTGVIETSTGGAKPVESTFALLPEIECSADLTGDDAIDVQDLLVLLGNWGTNGVGADIAIPLHVVDVFDLLAMLENWDV